MRKILAAFAFFLVFAPFIAVAGTGGGKVKAVNSVANGIVIISTDVQNSPPSCVAVIGDWDMDTKTPTGRDQYALVLTAVSQGKAVTITGSGACTGWGDRETISQVLVNY